MNDQLIHPYHETRQKHFNTVVSHLRNQGVPATGEKGDCRYRGANGTQCAIGCLIPDSDYNYDMEGYSLRRLLDRLMHIGSDLMKSGIFKTMIADIDFYYELQQVHDSWQMNINIMNRNANVYVALEREINRFSDRYKLTVPDCSIPG